MASEVTAIPNPDPSATDPAGTDQADGVASGPPIVTQDMLREGDPPTGWWGTRIRRIENWLTLKSTQSNRWHRFLAYLFLPLAYRSGIKLGKQKGESYEVVVPFRKFNKNWYNAMAGAALLGNSEVAGGMFIFDKVGPEYTVVCKELTYKFRRPCLGPAIYKVRCDEDVETLRKHKLEFNVTVEMDIVQAMHHKDEKQRKVGACTATFHVAPKAKLRARKAKLKERKNGTA